MTTKPVRIRLRSRRKLIWTTSVAVIVGIPLVLFALVGMPHLFRSAQVRNVIALEAGGAFPDIASAHFAPSFALQSGTPLTPGNTIEVLANGDETFPRLWSDLRSARRSITIQMYYAGPGEVADNVARILVERARAGVDVYFLHDAFGTQDLPQSYLETLRSGGVRTASFRPVRWYALDRASHRLHVRGVVVDGAIAYTGGFGFDDKWLGDGKQPGEWRETNVRFTGPAVAQLQAAFISNWAETTGALLTGEHFVPLQSAIPAFGGNAAAVSEAALVFSPPLEGSTAAERLIAFSIASARQRLYIANAYFIPDSNFMQLLVDAARRGVDVRLLTSGTQTDVKTSRHASRSRYEVLLAAGVRIYEYRPANMHAKTFVVDGAWSSVGTMNFDNRSLAYNSEVAVVALDAGLAARMEAAFFEDLRLSDEIRVDEFRKRPRKERWIEGAASRLASVL